MFRSKSPKILSTGKDTSKALTDTPEGKAPASPRYPKPKILLIDLKDDSFEVLKTAGYNVHDGSFGTPFSVARSNGYQAVPTTYRIPNYAEQEIVVIDLARPSLSTTSQTVEPPVEGDYAYWGKCNSGTVDPRPIASKIFRSSFDTIHYHGGVFIIFADLRAETEIVYARNSRRGIDDASEELKLWSFLECVDPKLFETEFSRGNEIKVVATNSGLTKLLSRHLDSAEFHCVFAPREYIPSNYDCQ